MNLKTGIRVLIGLGLTLIGIYLCWFPMVMLTSIDSSTYGSPSTFYFDIWFTGNLGAISLVIFGFFLIFASIPYFWFIKPYRERRKRY